MRFMLIVKATPESERGEMPADLERLVAEMGKFNQDMIAAGVLLDGAGLQSSVAGKRVRFEGLGRTVVTSGPFPNTTELASGYWILACKDADEALEWATRVPFSSGEVELRPLQEPEAFEGVISEDDIQKERDMLMFHYALPTSMLLSDETAGARRMRQLRPTADEAWNALIGAVLT